MKKKSRAFAALVCAVLALGATQIHAQLSASGYPNKPIKLVVPFAPGGATDILARDIGQKLSERLKQAVVIDNKPGAGTTIGTAAVAKSPNDGYTLLFAPTPFAISQVMYPKLPYDAQKDFTPVTLLAVSPFILVAHPSLPANSVSELVALAKAKPKSLSFASAGNGTVPHLAGEFFKLRAGIELVHVPYKGGGPAIIDLVGGQTQLMFATPVEVAQQIAAGRLKVLAATSPQRIPAYASAPTLQESGLRDYDIRSWFGVIAPAGTPPDIVAMLANEFAAVVQLPEIQSRFASQGAQVLVKRGNDFAQFIRADVTRWAEIVKASGATVD